MSKDDVDSGELGSKKVFFEPSTFETIDQSIFNYVQDLQLHADTNSGRQKTPVFWGTPERSFLSKNSENTRDNQGALRFPAISVARKEVNKAPPGSGIFIGNVPGQADGELGSLTVSKVINQEKTAAFAAAGALKTHKQENFPRENKKIVYQTVTVPMPVNVEVSYEITIRTEFQQQMNELLLPFLTIPGTVRAINLSASGHHYEGFIQNTYQMNDNLSSYSGEERKFESKVTIKVIGYLVGQSGNQEKPFYTVSENAVEIKLPRESVIVDSRELKKYGL